jgi:GTP cyclohydrolase FolE2
MDKTQSEKYQEVVDKWKEAAKSYGRGWDEDGPEIPVDYDLDVDMVNYHLAGLFKVFDGKTAHLFSNPKCDILARVRKVKAHMNRMISSLEFAEQDLGAAHPGQAVPVWEWARLATEKLCLAHHGSRFRVMANTLLTTKLAAHCTGLPSTLPWHARFGYELNSAWGGDGLKQGRYLFGLRTTVFTVCPFVLHETEGKQSHTQRSHVDVELVTDAPVLAGPIMREISTRLIPVMSNMKIPDEVVQVLKAYCGPTFTEDATVRVQKILRGITAEFVPDGQVLGCKVTVVSEDSHLAHDIKTTLECDLQ